MHNIWQILTSCSNLKAQSIKQQSSALISQDQFGFKYDLFDNLDIVMSMAMIMVTARQRERGGEGVIYAGYAKGVVFFSNQIIAINWRKLANMSNILINVIVINDSYNDA